MKFKIHILLLALLLCNAVELQAQTHDHFECGLQESQIQNMSLGTLTTPEYSGSVNPLYLAEFPKITFNIYFWVVKRTNGTTDYPITNNQILLEMQRINDFFRPVGICFVMQGTGSVNSDQTYAAGNGLGSIVSYAKANNYYKENSFNVYIHPDQSSGNGATNYGSNCIVMDSWVIQGLWEAPRHVLAHELGHTFDLVHTWGRTTGIAAAHTNEHVIRDPDDLNYNALIAGDEVADTPAMAQFDKEKTFYGLTIDDIINSAACEYIGPGKDNLDVPFVMTPDDLGNPMQYTLAHCVSEFTTGQAIRMREYIEASPDKASVEAMRANNDFITLSDPETNLSFIYQYSDYIVTNNNYQNVSGQNINLKAGDYIYLEPNTDIQEGSIFIAEIEECECESDNFSFQAKNNYAYKPSFGHNASGVKLYPNPNNGIFEITLAKKIKNDLNVEVYDLYGKLIYKDTKSENAFGFNLPDISAGMYIVQLSSGDYNETIKFIKQ